MYRGCNDSDHPCHLSAGLHCDDTTLPQGGNSRAKRVWFPLWDLRLGGACSPVARGHGSLSALHYKNV